MGIIEQILEENLNLNKRIDTLYTEFKMLNQEKESTQETKGIVVEFKENEKLNMSMTARVLGIKQTELDVLISKGLLQSCEKKKRLFLVKDIMAFLSFEKSDPKKEKTEKNKKQTRNINPKNKKDLFRKKEYKELLELNKRL